MALLRILRKWTSRRKRPAWYLTGTKPRSKRADYIVSKARHPNPPREGEDLCLWCVREKEDEDDEG